MRASKKLARVIAKQVAGYCSDQLYTWLSQGTINNVIYNETTESVKMGNCLLIWFPIKTAAFDWRGHKQNKKKKLFSNSKWHTSKYANQLFDSLNYFGIKNVCFVYGSLTSHLYFTLNSHQKYSRALYFWCLHSASKTHWIRSDADSLLRQDQTEHNHHTI